MEILTLRRAYHTYPSIITGRCEAGYRVHGSRDIIICAAGLRRVLEDLPRACQEIEVVFTKTKPRHGQAFTIVHSRCWGLWSGDIKYYRVAESHAGLDYQVSRILGNTHATGHRYVSFFVYE